ncbi:MAG: sodium transporter, partial [Bacteroidota bacterium]
MFKLLSTYDILIIAGYFAVVFAIAWWATWVEKRKKAGNASAGYFLAGKSASWFVIGASLFASNIGSEHLVGLAGAGARGDMVAAQFEVLAALILVLLG